MSHIVPILCLIFFILFIELQTKQQTYKIAKEFEELKRRIDSNGSKISKNSEDIKTNKENISKLNGEHLQ